MELWFGLRQSTDGTSAAVVMGENPVRNDFSCAQMKLPCGSAPAAPHPEQPRSEVVLHVQLPGLMKPQQGREGSWGDK